MIKRVKDDESKASLVCEYGIPEQTICDQMKEEDKLLSFVDSKEDNVELQRTKETIMYVSVGTSGFSKSTPSSHKRGNSECSRSSV